MHDGDDTMDKSLQKIYDGFAETYDQNRGLFDMRQILDSFYSRLNMKKGKLLDLGCGAGEPFARFFIDQGWQVTGVDFSSKMLALAARYVPEMKTIFSDMRDVQFKPEEFDAVIAVYSLFHIPHRQHAALFRNMFRWLAPGGKALFTYATKEYTGCDEFEGHKEFMGQRLFYSHKRPAELCTDLRETGFHIEATDYHEIGSETFLWVTVEKPPSARIAPSR